MNRAPILTLGIITLEMRANFRHLYADVFWFGILAGSVMAFLAVYAARLGASAFEISLLTAGPAVINLLFSLPAGRWLEVHSAKRMESGHNPRMIRFSFGSAFMHRLGYLALIPLPWLLAPQLEIWAIVLITLVMSVPGTFLAIAFNAMFADVVPPDLRSEVVGRRNAIVAISLTGTALLCGRILDQPIFPLNYQIVFGLGAVAALLSTYHLGQIRFDGEEPVKRNGRPIGDLARPGMLRFGDAVRLAVGLRFLSRSGGKSLLRWDLLRSSYGLFLAAYLGFYTFQYLPIPILPLAFVNVLDLTDGAISLGSALFHAAMALISLRIGEISARFGNKTILVAGGLAYGLYPLLVGLAHGATLYWIASFAGGIVWGMTNAALINHLMEQVPEDDRPAYMALHNLVLSVGILAGSLLGPVLASWLGIQQALVVGAILRMLAGFLLLAWS